MSNLTVVLVRDQGNRDPHKREKIASFEWAAGHPSAPFPVPVAGEIVWVSGTGAGTSYWVVREREFEYRRVEYGPLHARIQVIVLLYVAPVPVLSGGASNGTPANWIEFMPAATDDPEED